MSVGFETFDRDQVGPGEVGLVVKVDSRGRLLFNRPVWWLLADQYGAGNPLEVALLFDVERRQVGVRPLTVGEAKVMPTGQRWKTETMRGIDWPRSVLAPEFVAHYRISADQYAARAALGPARVVFEVGQARPVPVDVRA